MKKKICLLIILLLAVIIPVKALDIQRVETEKSNFIANEQVKTDKFIDGSAFVAGNNIDIESPIDGAAFIAGNNVNVGSHQDILFVAGNVVNLNNVATKDAFVAGSTINITSSKIRDLYAAAGKITIDSNIERNAYLAGDEIVINGSITGNVKIDAETIKIGKEAEIIGTLKYPDNAKITIAETAKINKKATYEAAKASNEVTLMSKLLDRLYAFLGMLLIGILMMAFCKKVFTKIEKIDKDINTFAKTFGMGFVFLVVVPIASIIVMCTIIGAPLAIITLILYGIMIYLSIIPTAYYLGNILLKDYIKNKYVLFMVSLLIIYVLRMIPGIGGLVTFISLCFGLGVYVIVLKIDRV